MYGQAHQCTGNEEEEVAPEDSASTRVSPTHGLTNALDILALVRNGTFIKEDVVMDHAQPDGFEEALQSFRAVQAKLDDVLADNDNGKLNVSRQLGQRRAGPPATMAEDAVEEIFMEQGVAGPSTTIEYEAGAGLLPLEDDESAIMSSLDSQLSDIAAPPGYPFWRYKRALQGTPILLPDPIADRGIPQGPIMWPLTSRNTTVSPPSIRPWEGTPPSSAMCCTSNPVPRSPPEQKAAMFTY